MGGRRGVIALEFMIAFAVFVLVAGSATYALIQLRGRRAIERLSHHHRTQVLPRLIRTD